MHIELPMTGLADARQFLEVFLVRYVAFSSRSFGEAAHRLGVTVPDFMALCRRHAPDAEELLATEEALVSLEHSRSSARFASASKRHRKRLSRASRTPRGPVVHSAKGRSRSSANPRAGRAQEVVASC